MRNNLRKDGRKRVIIEGVKPPSTDPGNKPFPYAGPIFSRFELVIINIPFVEIANNRDLPSVGSPNGKIKELKIKCDEIYPWRA